MNEQVRVVGHGGRETGDEHFRARDEHFQAYEEHYRACDEHFRAYEEHFRACVDDAGDEAEYLADADVLYFARPVEAREVVAQLAAFPGCVICAGEARDGTMVIAVRGGAESVPDIASAVHGLLVRAATSVSPVRSSHRAVRSGGR